MIVLCSVVVIQVQELLLLVVVSLALCGEWPVLLVMLVLSLVSLDWVFPILRGVLWVSEESAGVCRRGCSAVAVAADVVLVVEGLVVEEV